MKLRSLFALSWICMLSGCSDPLKDLVNSKWPPISVEQQREAAIQSAAQTLAKLTMPNVAFGVLLSDAQKVALSEDLKKLGVSDVSLAGDKQLLSLSVKFSRAFTEVDAGDNADLRNLVATLRPEITGKIAIHAGFTSGLATQGATPTLELRVLPALAAITVDKIKLAEKVDVTKVGELLAALLNRYKDNVSGEVSRAPFTLVTIPALASGPVDVSKSFKVINTGVAATVDVKASPITVPFKLDGVAWLVTDKELTVLVQLVPVAAGAAAPAASSVEPTFDAVKKRVEELTKASFDVPAIGAANWVAIRKDLLASATNNVVSQSGLCVSAIAETPNQHVSATIPMPKADDISCGQSTPCNVGACSFHMDEDRRGCGDLDFGCRAFREAENIRRRTQANADVAACQIAEASKKGVCELGKEAARVLCEGAKAGLKILGPNFGRVDADLKLKTNGVQVCLRDFALSPALDKVQFALDVQGKALADVNVKFTPLDIVGHLTCPFPWSKAQTFEASLRDSRLGISSPMQFVVEKGVARVDFATEPLTVKGKLSQSPVEYLLNSPAMSVACPIVNAAKPLVVTLTPFVKELRGDIDYTLPQQKATLDLTLPTQTVADATVSPKVSATTQALVVTGTLVAPK